MKHKKFKVTLISIVAILLVLVIACGAYVSDYYPGDSTALAALEGSEGVAVEIQEDRMIFLPEDPVAGFIFYPGGKVEYTAYAPLMKALAEEDILCILLKMPCNLAVLDMDAAEGIPEQYPEVETWYIGGHSLGGSMAASRAAKNPGAYAGVALLASYSTESLTDFNVVSVYGSEDEVLNMEKYAEYRGNLPEDASEHIIDGGCHAWFGSYGPQDGDGTPTITAGEQTEITAALLMEFFAEET